MSSSNEYFRQYSSTAAAVAAAMFAVAPAIHADTVTLAPPTGTTTNVLALYTGDTAVEIAGPGTVKLNNANSHSGGTTLTGGTLEISSDVTASGRSPVGTGTFTVSGGMLRGSGTFGGNITGEGAMTLVGNDTFTLTGNNTFAEPLTISEGTVEIAGGTTTLVKHMYLNPAADEPVGYLQSGGSVTLGTSNLHLSYKAGSTSSFTMTGGTFDANGVNALVGYNVANASATVDISGGAILRNIGNFYTHSKSGNKLDVSVHDGGTLGFDALYSLSSDGCESLLVDGGTLLNETNGSSRAGANWIKESLNSFKIGPKGGVFSKTSGSSTALAQIRVPILAEAAGKGESAKGVTFNAGNWGYYVAGNAYEGPTVIKSGAALFLYSNGTIPSGSVVTVASGGELCICGAADRPKTVSSLVLQDGAILGFGSNLNILKASESITLPSSAKIALYNNANPTTGKNNNNGTYAVLTVPAAYEAALRAVRWSCATAASGKAYTFSVATSGDWTTLSMTIADDPNAGAGSITGSSTLNADDYAVASDIVVNNSGTLVAKKNIYGSATGGSIIINDGGTLDASAGTISPVNASGNSFQLHLNDGGNLVVNSIEGAQYLADESTSTPMFHFNGGTIYPSFAKKPNDGNRFLLNYQAALIGEHGVVIDMTRLQRPDDYTRWVRSSIQGNVNHDPDCSGDDGGITIRGVKGDRSVVYFGNRFNGSTLTGGISVEDGATVAIGGSALIGQTISLDPGARLRPYNTTSTIQIGSLTLGKTEATEPVLFDGSDSMANYNIVVSNELSVLSPVVFSVCGGWDKDSSPASGVYTALVYQASCSVDPSLFQLPAGCAGTLSASEVSISGGDYDGWKALVCTISQNDLIITGTAANPSPVTISADATYGMIAVGGSSSPTAADDPILDTSLTINDATVTATDTFYVGYYPLDGVDAETGGHQGFVTLNGGTLSVPRLYTIYRGSDGGTNPRFGADIEVNGGLIDVAGDVLFGYNRERYGEKLYSRLTVNNGRVAVGGAFNLLYYNYVATTGDNRYSSPGSIVLNGGEVDVTGVIDLGRNSLYNANYNERTSYRDRYGIWLNGGVLKAENIEQTAAAAVPKIYFNGGTYIPYGAAAENRTMQNLNVTYVSTNGAIISTENLPAGETYTIAQDLLTDPALSGTADGGLTKKGAGTLALTGDNTFTGPTIIEKGTLSITNAAALSASIEVADGAALDANGADLSIGTITASGAVNGNLTVTNAIVLTGEDSILSVDGDLELQRGVTIDFAAFGGNVPRDWTPVAAVSGSPSVTDFIRARNAGDYNRCTPMIVDGVLYVMPTSAGFTIVVK